MKLRKLLSVMLAVVIVASAAAIALAEGADTAQTEPAAADAAVTQATVQPETYTVDAMLTAAMTDAYTRQAAYAAYAEAYPDSRSLSALDMDTQIVLLEMLLKANNVALPAANADVTVPETLADTYTAVAQAENGTVALLNTYLQQENLGKDAQIIFNTVRRDSYENALLFNAKARAAQQQQEWTNLMNDENTRVYVIDNDGPFGWGRQTVYVYSSNGFDDAQTAADDAPDATAAPAQDSVSD